NALVTRGYDEAERARWERMCQAARDSFQSRRYAIVRDLIHPLQLSALRQYYRAVLDGGEIPLGDWVADRYYLLGELMATFWPPQLTRLVSRIPGQPVKPLYTSFASYLPGAVLPPHRDRPQSEFVMSLLVDYDPDPGGPCGWPLLIQDPATPDVVGEADLAIG